MGWRYTNASQLVVWRRNGNGGSGKEESHLASAHVPEDGDPPIAPAFTVTLVPSKTAILANGTDESVVTVTWVDPYNAAPASITLAVGGMTKAVPITNGVGISPGIVATHPCEIIVDISGNGAWHSTSTLRALPATIVAG